jgi:hypothetical protein
MALNTLNILLNYSTGIAKLQVHNIQILKNICYFRMEIWKFVENLRMKIDLKSFRPKWELNKINPW